MTTETLIPNAAGDENNNNYWDGDSWEAGITNNYQSIDDPVATPDDDTTKIKVSGGDGTWTRDLYNLPAHSGSGTINNITIYFRISSTIGVPQAKPVLKSDSTVTEGTDQLGTSGEWITKSQTWTTNPADSQAWEWDDIDALQIGVSLYNVGSGKTDSKTECTQVYAVIDYTAATGTNCKINIGDAFKDISEMKINVGDAWKTVF